MKNINTVFIILVFLSYFTFGQDKSKYDINFQVNPTDGPLGIGSSYILHNNAKTGITLLKDGYFTIGTNSGKSESQLDDSCQISFGHPYAKTSLPYFRINGLIKYPGEYFFGQPIELEKTTDTLKMRANNDPHFAFHFYLIAEDLGKKIKGVLKIINKDNSPVNASAGILFDPALGKWGDGFIYDNGVLIQESKTYLSTIPQSFSIWERNINSKGLGVSLNFTDGLPDNLEINNWFSLYKNQNSSQSLLYDAAIRFEKNNTELASGDTLTIEFNITLLQPEFPNGLFIRSQLPQFLSIENSLLFPSQTSLLTEVYNNSSTNYQNLSLSLLGGEYIEDYMLNNPFQLNAGFKAYKSIFLKSHELYDNVTFPLKLDLLSNSVLQDEIVRNIFIPASPVSDTGLTISIDSIKVTFPNIKLRFSARKQSNGAFLNGLKKENIFLYEDLSRITNLTLTKDTAGGAGQVDIVFILDVTGSMGNEIAGVKNNIIEFADSLVVAGTDYRLGMVTFLDEIENVYNFTSDAQHFKGYVSQQYAHGGGDRAENSLAALMRGAELEFRPSANRIFIWITDADYHINNSYTQLTIQEVVNEMLTNSIKVFNIGASEFQTEFYDPIVLPTGGKYFNIVGNFRDILLEISRTPFSNKYFLSYNSNGSVGTHQIKLQLHYAGLGGDTTITYNSSSDNLEQIVNEEVACYPNPFNPVTNVIIKNPGLYSGEALVYNVLGQRVKSFSFNSGQSKVLLTWNAANDSELPVGNGIYFVRVSFFNADASSRNLPVQKLIYIK